MRVIELEINNIRGICNLTLNPNGRNLVVWGSNGSGKSAVVDAIDFLLTGHMSRLMGQGTGDIKLELHGTHIEHQPKDAMVRAIITIRGYKKPIEVKRCMDSPGNLQYTDPKDKIYLEPVLSIASRGQHVLTRREILKYITAEPSNRAQGILAILDLKDIQKIRETFVNVENKCDKELDVTIKTVRLIMGEICGITGEKTYTPAFTLDYINQKRRILGGQPIPELKACNIKNGLTPQMTPQPGKTINTIQLKSDIDAFNVFQSAASIEQLVETNKILDEHIQAIKSNPNLLKSLKRLRLIQLGIELLESDGACPLCDTPWPKGQLKRHLEQHLQEAGTANKHQADVYTRSDIIVTSLTSALAQATNIIYATELIELLEETTKLRLWVKGIKEIIEHFVKPIDNYDTKKITREQLIAALKMPDGKPLLEGILKAAEAKYLKTTPIIDAWDTLTKLENRMTSYEKMKEEVIKQALIHSRAELLKTEFLSARDSILQGLYDSVRDRFVELYRQIHQEDEANFNAQLKSDDAGIDFKVDFYGHGKHPPHALHSEGHQDSMGVCLYLALAEKLTKGIIDLIILDDVVMSVDAGHRRKICDILTSEFPDNQFLITTHDKTWANQLKITNVVDRMGTVHFYNWRVTTGPQVDSDADVWGRITQDLSKDDVSSAAGKLRQNAEQFFATICDSLQAQVIFKLDGTHDLGELLSGAVGQYKKLLGKAKAAANSWGRKEEIDKLDEFENIINSIYERTNAEKWAINPAIHHSKWENFSKEDFQPVVDAFNDLYGVFSCIKCGSLLRVVVSGAEQQTIRCDCLQVNWNLVLKHKTTI